MGSLSCLAETGPFESEFEGYEEGQEENKNLPIFAAVGSGFNYQGELLNVGVAANGNFDFSFGLFDAAVGGNQIGGNVIKGNRPVTNGLFSIEGIDFGDAVYDGDELWLRVTVRETGNPGSETTLSPRQKISAVPYAVQADYLGPIGASNGDVLTFIGGEWVPSSSGGTSPWSVSGSNIYYSTGLVGIGVTNPSASFHVNSPNVVPAIFDGGSSMYVLYRENGVNRGYIGSYQNPSTPGINDEDFEIGTFMGSVGSVHIATGNNEPRLTVTADGDVGIGSVSPMADLMIEADDQGEVLRARINSSTKFHVNGNGGTAIGAYSTPPADGLYVNGDLRQPLASNGFMKYMVHVYCGSSPSIVKQYNGIGNGTITVSGSSAGQCVVDFPTNIDNRYWQVSVVYGSTSASGQKAANCRLDTGSTDKLFCNVSRLDQVLLVPGNIMILIY
ncbi:MAG: hypothetical protein DWP95_03670 [Proteobacteria bacterium]|nr:MAG: hypothetical protein DWP95_03670 [Pseudomonadota bacterium]